LLTKREVVSTQKIYLPTLTTKTSKEIENIQPEIKVLLVGDVMLGRKVMLESQKKKDFVYPFRKVASTLSTSDIVFINLENPMVKDCPYTYAGFKFCSPPESAEGLVSAGVDVVNLANNHSMNYGQAGINETLEILGDKEILATGLGELKVLEKQGTSFGFLGFDFTVKEPIAADYEQIKNADEQVDILIVGVHWGVEYTDKPTVSQRLWAKKMVEAGADVISGHHPHWVQGVDCIAEDGSASYIAANDFKRGSVCQESTVPIFYSLGNFIFDQMWSEETKKGAIVELTFSSKGGSASGRKGGTLQGRVPSGTRQGMKTFRTYIRNWGQVEFVD